MKKIMQKLRLAVKRKNRSWIWKVTGIVIVAIVAGCSITVNSVDQPATVTGGTPMVVTLNGTISTNATQTSALVVGVLVPKIWNASTNTTMSFTSDITSGAQPMTLIPAGTADPYGNGLSWQDDLMNTIGHAGNLIPEYEWIAFQSNSQYAVASGATFGFTVTIKINVPTNNVLFNMAYCVAESTDGLHNSSNSQAAATSYYGTFFPGSVRIDGTGTLLDFVNPQLSTIVPGSSLDNDIITIPFNSTATANNLGGASSVYLCATGYLSTGDSVKICEQTSRTQLANLGLGQWQIDIWPHNFFGLSDSQKLDSMEYFFTDATGSTKVGYSGGSSPFSYTFSCQ